MGLRSEWWRLRNLGFYLLLFPLHLGAEQCSNGLELQSPTDRLVILDQPGVDIRIIRQVSGQATNGPEMNYGPEFIFAPARSDSLQLCLEPVYDIKSKLPPVSYRVIALSGAEQTRLARLLEEGFRAWALGTPQARQKAIELWLQFSSEARSSSNQALQELVPVVTYLAADGLRQRYLYFDADKLLAKVNTENSAFLNYAVQKSLASMISFTPSRREDAIAALEEVIDIAQRHYPQDLAEHYVSLSLPYLLAGELKEGEKYLKLAEQKSFGRPRNLALLYNNVGWLSKLLGDQEPELPHKVAWYRQSIDEHSHAAQLAIDAGDQVLLSLIYNNRGTIQSRIGDDFGALESHHAALLAVEGVDSQRSQTSALSNLAGSYLRLGDYRRAMQYTDLSIERRTKSEMRFAANAYCAKGRLYRELGNYAESIHFYQECERVAGRQHLQANIGLGRTYLALENWDQALVYLGISRQIMAATSNTATIDRFNDSANIARISASEALALAHQGKPERARQVASEAETYIGFLLNNTIKLEVYRPLLRVYELIGDLERAIQLGFDAIDLIEQVYSRLEPERVGPAWTARSSDIYQSLIRLMTTYRQPSAEDLLQLVERSRATNLRLRLSAEIPDREALDSSATDRLKTLSKLANRRALQPKATTFEQYYRQELYHGENPEQLQTVATPPDVIQIRHALGPGQVALVFQSVAGRWLRFTVSKTRLELARLPLTGNLEQLAAEFTRAVVEQDPDWRDKAQPLENLLTGIDWQQTLSTVVIAHGELEFLPWSALYTAIGVPENIRASTSPSLSVFVDSVSIHDPRPLEVSIFADPKLGNPPGAHATSWSDTLQPLPWSAREAMAIEQKWNVGQIHNYLSDRATREAFFSRKTRESAVLHIASHGFFNASDPDNVGFVLSSDTADSRGSFVTLTDLYAYRFSNQLVVVSGCETAIGQHFKGEGSNSLARAFIAQGAEHVISTYWKVSDRASATFMRFLYEELASTGHIAQAYWQAQQRLRRHPRFRHPYYWSAYNLSSRGMRFDLEP